MPPELLQFLLASQLQGGGQSFQGQQQPFLGPESATQPGFPDPFTRPSFAERAPFGATSQPSDLGFLGPQPGAIPLPTAGGFGGAASLPAAGGLASFDPTLSLGGTIPQPLGATAGSEGAAEVGGEQSGFRTFLNALGRGGAGFAEGVARARLGGGGGGGAAPGTGGAASFPGSGRVSGGGLPGQSGAQIGGVVTSLGLQQQADVQQQRQLAADLFGSLLGGAGGAVGGILGGGGGGGASATATATPPAAGGLAGFNPNLSAGQLGFLR